MAGKEHHKTHEALRAGAFLLQHPPEENRPHFFYGVYYTAQAMFQLGDNYWAEYRPRLHGLLLKANPPRANGACKPIPVARFRTVVCVTNSTVKPAELRQIQALTAA